MSDHEDALAWLARCDVAAGDLEEWLAESPQARQHAATIVRAALARADVPGAEIVGTRSGVDMFLGMADALAQIAEMVGLPSDIDENDAIVEGVRATLARDVPTPGLVQAARALVAIRDDRMVCDPGPRYVEAIEQLRAALAAAPAAPRDITAVAEDQARRINTIASQLRRFRDYDATVDEVPMSGVDNPQATAWRKVIPLATQLYVVAVGDWRGVSDRAAAAPRSWSLPAPPPDDVTVVHVTDGVSGDPIRVPRMSGGPDAWDHPDQPGMTWGVLLEWGPVVEGEPPARSATPGDTPAAAAPAGPVVWPPPTMIGRNGCGIWVGDDWSVEQCRDGEVHFHESDHRDPPGTHSYEFEPEVAAAIGAAAARRLDEALYGPDWRAERDRQEWAAARPAGDDTAPGARGGGGESSRANFGEPGNAGFGAPLHVVDAVDRALTDLTGQPQIGSAYARAFVKRLAEYGVEVRAAAGPRTGDTAPPAEPSGFVLAEEGPRRWSLVDTRVFPTRAEAFRAAMESAVTWDVDLEREVPVATILAVGPAADPRAGDTAPDDAPTETETWDELRLTGTRPDGTQFTWMSADIHEPGSEADRQLVAEFHRRVAYMRDKEGKDQSPPERRTVTTTRTETAWKAEQQA